MMRYLKILFLSMAVIGLMSGSAFAAATLNAGNTTHASELVPAAGLAIPAVNTAYQPAGSVAASSQLKISLTNATFGATVVNICDNAGAAFGGAVPVAASTSVVITTTQALSSGVVYNLQPAACAAGPVPLTQISIAAGAVGGAVVSMSIDNNLSPGDTNVFATATIITLVDQLSAQLITPATDILDFGSSPVMSKFKAGGSGTNLTSVAKIVVLSDETLGAKIASGHAGSNTTCAAWPATAEALSFTASPGGTATTMGAGFDTAAAFAAAGAAAFTLKAAIASTDTSATGNATLTANLTANTCGAGASTTLKTTAANQITTTLKILGTSTLTARSYKLAVGTTVSGAIVAAARPILAATTAWTWGIDASQYYIPLVGSNPATGRETFIKLQSKNTQAGSNGVSVAILAADGSTTATFTGAITAGVPLTITGAQLLAAATAAGKTIDGQAGFAVIVTVNAPEADVFAFANMTDAAGVKRIPVKTVGGTVSE